MRSSRRARSGPAVVVVLDLALILPPPATAAPEGQITWGVHISLAPTWFDPAETPGMITPFMVLYALHDAMVKPMPGQADGAEPRRVVDGLAATGSSTSSSCARARASTTASPSPPRT